MKVEMERFHGTEERTVDACYEWLKDIPWQVYGTFTFPRRVDDWRADKTFTTLIRILETRYRKAVVFLRGDEKRSAPSGLGKPATGRHFHSVLASLGQLEPGLIEHEWKGLVGLDGHAKVSPYDQTRNALRYCLKGLEDPTLREHSDWKLSDNAYLFVPDAQMNSRMRRKLRRMNEHKPRWSYPRQSRD